MAQAPLIFIHTGDSKYLHYSLTTAKLLNPDKNVILLGDDSNQKYACHGISFCHIDSVPKSTDREKFNEVFQPIVGDSHGKESWVKFVFERWFILADYAQEHSLDDFWTFDSDTMILTQLGALEESLRKYDCTEQCNGMCISGYVPHTSIARKYVQFINELYSRPDYLNEWRMYVANNPTHAFTEMGAYASFKKEKNLNAFHLMKENDGTMFDDCICQEHKMEMYTFPRSGIRIKQLYRDEGGFLYSKHIQSGNFIRLLALNMSWAPEFMYKKIFSCAHRASRFDGAGHSDTKYAIDNNPSVYDRIAFRLNRIFRNFSTSIKHVSVP